jgi:hypothetical protein
VASWPRAHHERDEARPCNLTRTSLPPQKRTDALQSTLSSLHPAALLAIAVRNGWGLSVGVLLSSSWLIAQQQIFGLIFSATAICLLLWLCCPNKANQSPYFGPHVVVQWGCLSSSIRRALATVQQNLGKCDRPRCDRPALPATCHCSARAPSGSTVARPGHLACPCRTCHRARNVEDIGRTQSTTRTHTCAPGSGV